MPNNDKPEERDATLAEIASGDIFGQSIAPQGSGSVGPSDNSTRDFRNILRNGKVRTSLPPKTNTRTKTRPTMWTADEILSLMNAYGDDPAGCYEYAMALKSIFYQNKAALSDFNPGTPGPGHDIGQVKQWCKTVVNRMIMVGIQAPWAAFYTQITDDAELRQSGNGAGANTHTQQTTALGAQSQLPDEDYSVSTAVQRGFYKTVWDVSNDSGDQERLGNNKDIADGPDAQNKRLEEERERRRKLRESLQGWTPGDVLAILDTYEADPDKFHDYAVALTGLLTQHKTKLPSFNPGKPKRTFSLNEYVEWCTEVVYALFEAGVQTAWSPFCAQMTEPDESDLHQSYAGPVGTPTRTLKPCRTLPPVHDVDFAISNAHLQLGRKHGLRRDPQPDSDDIRMARPTDSPKPLPTRPKPQPAQQKLQPPQQKPPYFDYRTANGYPDGAYVTPHLRQRPTPYSHTPANSTVIPGAQIPPFGPPRSSSSIPPEMEAMKREIAEMRAAMHNLSGNRPDYDSDRQTRQIAYSCSLMNRADMTFDGKDPEAFPIWEEAIRDQIETAGLTEQQALILLKRSLKGNAIRMMKEWLPGTSFESAMQSLRVRYVMEEQQLMDEDLFWDVEYDPEYYTSMQYLDLLKRTCPVTADERVQRKMIIHKLKFDFPDGRLKELVAQAFINKCDLDWLERKFREHDQKFGVLSKWNKGTNRSKGFTPFSEDKENNIWCTRCRAWKDHNGTQCRQNKLIAQLEDLKLQEQESELQRQIAVLEDKIEQEKPDAPDITPNPGNDGTPFIPNNVRPQYNRGTRGGNSRGRPGGYGRGYQGYQGRQQQFPDNRQHQGNQQVPDNRQYQGNQQVPDNRQYQGNQQVPDNRQYQGNQQFPDNRQYQGNQRFPENRQYYNNQQQQGNGQQPDGRYQAGQQQLGQQRAGPPQQQPQPQPQQQAEQYNPQNPEGGDVKPLTPQQQAQAAAADFRNQYNGQNRNPNWNNGQQNQGWRDNSCYNCGDPGHHQAFCNQPRRNPPPNHQPQRQFNMFRRTLKEERKRQTVPIVDLKIAKVEPRNPDPKENLTILFNSVPVKFKDYLMDTGAPCNLVSKKFAEENGFPIKPVMHGGFTAVNNSEVKVAGGTHINIKMKCRSTRALFYVMDGLTDKVLIGRHSMRRLGLRLVDELGNEYTRMASDQTVNLICRIKEQLKLKSGEEQVCFIWKDKDGKPVMIAEVDVANPLGDISKIEEKKSKKSLKRKKKAGKHNIPLPENKSDKEHKVTLAAVNEDDEPETGSRRLASGFDMWKSGEPDSVFVNEEDLGPELGKVWEDYVDVGDMLKAKTVDNEEAFKAELKIGDQVPEDEKHTLQDALWAVRKAFCSEHVAHGLLSVKDLGCTAIEHVIHTTGGPFKVRPRRIPLAKMAEVEAMIEDMLDTGVIRPSVSPYASCIVMVKKKDGTYRQCVDYRDLNAQTVPDRTPIPRINELLDETAGKQWYSALDVKSAFHNVKLREEDREKTAFIHGDKLFEYMRMPFGLSTAAQTFQRVIVDALKDIPEKCCRAYLDDILVFSDSLEQHIIDVRNVSEACGRAGLRLNPKKCVFAMTEVKYLGHLISREGIRADPEKVAAVKDYKRPNTKRQLRRFLGITRYLSRFYKDLERLLKPLNEVLSDGKRLHGRITWTKKAADRFEELKTLLSSPPCLRPPQVGKRYYLITDASDSGYGGVLTQEDEETGELRPIFYTSKACNAAELNYSATEREARAVIHCLDKYRHYLLAEEVVIYTDHKPLVGMFAKPDPTSARMYRWILNVQQYRVQIRYLPGVHNIVADALSRVYEPDDPREKVKFDEHGEPVAVNCFKTLTVEPVGKEQRKAIVQRFHAGEAGAHSSWQKIVKMLQKFYTKQEWPDMVKEAKECVSRCNPCRMRSVRYETTIFQPLEPPPRPGCRWHLDYTLLRSGSKIPALAVAVDAFSRYAIAVPAKKQDTDTAIELMNRIWQHSGRPYEICTDSGTHFTSKAFQEQMDEWEITHTIFTPYQKTSNGMVERVIQTLQGIIGRKLVDKAVHPDQWHKLVQESQLAYNVAPHSSLGMRSPYEVERGIPFQLSTTEPMPKPELEQFWAVCRKHMLAAREVYIRRRRGQVKETRFYLGQQVWIQHTQGMRQRKRKVDMINNLKGEIVGFKHRSATLKLDDGRVIYRPLSMLQPRFEEQPVDPETVISTLHEFWPSAEQSPEPEEKRTARKKKPGRPIRLFPTDYLR